MSDFDASLLASMMVPGSLGIGELSARVPEMVAQLAEHELSSTAARVAGLMTLPHMHAHTIRLEALAHMAIAHCHPNRGKKPRRKQFIQWMNGALGQLAWLEDPVEDVFVSNVVSGLGDHRLFEGIWEAPDFYTQRTIEAVGSVPAEPYGARLRWHVGSLLKLSEALAARSKVSRYKMGGGSPHQDMPIPSDERIAFLARRVNFTHEELHRLGIEPQALAPFVYLADRGTTRSDVVGRSSLESCPLISAGDRIIVALPTAVSIAVRRFFLQQCHNYGTMDSAQSEIEQRERDLFNSDLLHFWRGPSEPPAVNKPADLPLIDDAIYDFDEGKYAHVVLLHDRLERMRTEGLDAPGFVTPEEGLNLDTYLGLVATHLAAIPGFRGGTTVLVSAGLGRGIMLRLGKRPEGWLNIMFSLADFDMLSHLNGISLLNLCKMKDQVAKLEANDIQIMNLSGDINLFTFWRDQRWTFVPNDFSFGRGAGMISISNDFVAKLRHELRTAFDEHATPLPDGGKLIVHRKGHDYWFSGLGQQPMFLSPEHLKNGSLLGVVETQKRPWWISISGDSKIADRGFVFQLWDAALNWTTRVAPMIDPDLPGTNPLLIEIDLEALSDIGRSREEFSALQPEEPQFVQRKDKVISVVIPKGWCALLREPTNSAEKSLSMAIAKGAASTSGVAWSEKFGALIEKTFADPGARFLHVLEASDFRDFAREFHTDEVQLIPPEDKEWSRLGAAWLVLDQHHPTRIEGRADCCKFLINLVDKIWLRIRRCIRQFDRLSVISQCIQRIESNALDSRIWRISTRALFALHGDEVFAVSRKHEHDRIRAAIACRVAIEMAVCECPAAGGINIGASDLDSILADIDELVSLAHHSDAIRHGYAAPFIDVSASGRLSLDDAFYTDVVIPYSRDDFDSRLRDAAESYEDQVSNRVDTKLEDRNTDALDIDPKWEAAFSAEYGLPPGRAGDLVGALQDDAMQGKRIAVVKSGGELDILAVQETGQAVELVRKFFASLTLPTRARWDERRPQGFEQRDWEPWRYQRRLSAMSRPFFQIDAERVAYSPGMVEDTLKYLVGISLWGNPSPEFFASSAMKMWVGGTVADLGEKFNRQVYEKVVELRLQARQCVLMSELGAPSTLAEMRQSDVDVLSWSVKSRTIFIIECKRLKFAKTIGEIADQLNDFREAKDPTGKNSLAKHAERVAWLDANRAELERITSIPVATMRIRPLIVTSRTVPMQFASSLPGVTKEIVSFPLLHDRLHAELHR